MKNKQTKSKSAKTGIRTEWNLGLLYKSPTDPQIEKDVVAFEALRSDFAKKFDIADKRYLVDAGALLGTLKAYEEIVAKSSKPIQYFELLRDVDSKNEIANSQIPLLSNRLTKAANMTKFFRNSLGSIVADKQKEFLASGKLKPYRFFLACTFSDAKYFLSVPEEKIMSLKGQPSYDMWVDHNQRILSTKTITWKGKKMPLPQALNNTQSIGDHVARQKMATLVNEVLKDVSQFTEGEVNAVYTNKKINDELRGYKTPYEDTVHNYRNDPKVVENLVATVTKEFPIAHRFYRVKARLLKQKRLGYCDRGAKMGSIKQSFSFDDSLSKLLKIFVSIDKKYSDTLGAFSKKGQIDAMPKVGKTSGAYCCGSYENPTFVLLNHVGNLHSFTTFAHEMGHAFHTELSRSQGPWYSGYSTSLAETASTLFESIALESIFEGLSEKEKILVLHDRINDDIATVFRQIACFNFELDLHNSIRAKGFLSKEEIADIHNKNMKAYLGPLFDLKQDDGYMFVQWSHIRRFFYVYSYAYGMLVSKALLRKYKKDKSFWSSIEKFLSSGGKDTPENILKEIGLDLSKPDFWMEGLKEIEDDIIKLEKLTSKK